MNTDKTGTSRLFRGHLQPGYARAERHLRHPDVGPVQGRNPLGLRFLRRFRLARTVEGDRLANERLEGGLVNFFSFVDIDRAACGSVETRVEETGRILQRRALGEGKLHDVLVGFARADDAVVRPNRSAHPLPLLDDVPVCFLDELAHSAEGFPAPVPEFGDSFRDELRSRLAFARARLFHVLILEVPDIFHLPSASPARRAASASGCSALGFASRSQLATPDWSERKSTGLPLACSGDMCPTVPITVPGCVSWMTVGNPEACSVGATKSLARPKSRSLAKPSFETMTSSGFRSRCTIPAECALASPSAICTPMPSILFVARGPEAIRSRR